MLARGDRVVNVLSVTQQSTISSTTVPGSTHPITTNQNPVQTSTHTPSINTSPFFPEPSTLNPQPNPQSWSQDLAKTVLTFLTVILVVILVFSLAFKRYLHLQRTDQPFSQFFPRPRRRTHPTTHAPNSSLMPPVQAQTQTSIQSPSNSRTRSRSRPAEYAAYALPFTPSLTALMDDDVRYPITAASLALPRHTFPAYTHSCPHHSHSYPPHIATRMLQHRNNRTRTRAANTDAQGRRLDSGWDPDQFDFEAAGGQAQGGGDHEDKEMLPAYDCYGGPPKYIDVAMEVNQVEGARGTINDGNSTMGGDGSGNGQSERPTSSSAVVGHHDVVDHAQENGR